jgi:hypothetical protein
MFDAVRTLTSPDGWEMSPDHAAVLTGLIVAILAVGTAQAYATVRKRSDKETRQWENYLAAQARITTALRENRQPAQEDVKAKHPQGYNFADTIPTRIWKSLGYGFQFIVFWSPLLVWLSLCGLLCKSQLRILIWLGQEGAEEKATPGSEIAQQASLYIVIALVYLVAEAVMRPAAETIAEMFERRKSAPAERWENTPEYQAFMREYIRTGNIPQISQSNQSTTATQGSTGSPVP